MKKSIIICCIFTILMLTWCDTSCNNDSVKEITETIQDRKWDRTCVWSWINKIEWLAKCKNSKWDYYEWDMRWNKFNWKGKLTYLDWESHEWYFYNWWIVAWKITKNNGDTTKGIYRGKRDWVWLEFWKIFTKSNWNIKLWDFDAWWNITYWLIQNDSTYYVGKFFQKIWDPLRTNKIKDGYVVNSQWCSLFSNWDIKDITKTVTNTVYGNIWFKSALSQQWTILNPYVVNLRIKDY